MNFVLQILWAFGHVRKKYVYSYSSDGHGPLHPREGGDQGEKGEGEGERRVHGLPL